VAIEFSCPKCQHLLRTSEDKAGLSAKCPACGSPIWVPYPHEVPPAAAAPDEAPAPGGEPAAAAQANPFGSEEPGRPAGDEAVIKPADADAQAVSTVGQPLTVHCPNCAAANDAGAPACRFCGSSLEGVQPTAPPDWRAPRFDVSEIMSTSWRLYAQEIGLLIGCQLLSMLTMAGFVVVLAVPIAIGVAILQDQAAVLVVPIAVLALPLLFVLMAMLSIGMTRLYLNVSRGLPRSVGDMFYGFGEGRRYLGRALLIMVAALASILAGALACCIPAILIFMCWWPAMPLLLDRDCPGGDAIGRTYEFARQKFGQILGVGALAFAVWFIAGMVPYLGGILQIFAAPFAALMTTVAYLRLTEQTTAFD
jgi:hypothetical protein